MSYYTNFSITIKVRMTRAMAELICERLNELTVWEQFSVCAYNSPLMEERDSWKLEPYDAYRQKDGTLKRKVKKKGRETKDASNVWEFAVGGNLTGHPAVFPEQLANDHIISWSNEGDVVYDCFGGSGTTAKMAHKLKRNWILSEISKEYCEIAEKRITPYLAQTSLF